MSCSLIAVTALSCERMSYEQTAAITHFLLTTQHATQSTQLCPVIESQIYSASTSVDWIWQKIEPTSKAHAFSTHTDVCHVRVTKKKRVVFFICEVSKSEE
jgi:hypothetical protein